MAKTAKKKQAVTANPRSRAAKRASSPSINTDKSIKTAPRVSGTDPILGVTVHAGIKRKPRTRHLSRAQKVRQEKGLARAEVVLDQLAVKVDGARTKERVRSERRRGWGDVNGAVVGDEKRMGGSGGVFERGVDVQDGLGVDVEGLNGKEEGMEGEGDVDMDTHTAKSNNPAVSTSTDVVPMQDHTNEAHNHQAPSNPNNEESDLIS